MTPQPPPGATRQQLWQWALENLPTLRDFARRRPPGPGGTTSIVNSFLAGLFDRPTEALRAIRNRTAYAARGVRNVIVGKFRRRPKDAALAEEVPDRPGAAAGPADDRRAAFQLAWAELGPDERYVVEAHELDGVSSDRIGETLGVSGDAVRKRKEKVVERLRDGVALLLAAAENRWGPGTVHHRLVCLRHFRGLSVDAMAGELGWSRRQAQTWLDRTRAQLPAELRGLL